MSILTVAESSQALTHGALYLSITSSHGWLKTALHRVQCIFNILWKYSNMRRNGAALINFSAPSAAFNWGAALI